MTDEADGGVWWPREEFAYWQAVEAHLVDLSLGSDDGTRRLVRSAPGRFVLEGLRRMQPVSQQTDPRALAERVLRWRQLPVADAAVSADPADGHPPVPLRACARARTAGETTASCSERGRTREVAARRPRHR